MNALLVFILTLGDSLCGCLQVYNVMHRKRVAAFLTSLALATCKVLAVLLVVKSNSPDCIVAYVLGGTIGAQLCFFRK